MDFEVVLHVIESAPDLDEIVRLLLRHLRCGEGAECGHTYYQPFLFQAKGEEQAADLADIQAMQWELLSKRLQALIYLLQSADDMVGYQAQLDRVKSLGKRPEANPVLGYQSNWARTDMTELARREIDTMVDLNRLLESTREPILDLAPTVNEETIMRLGPDITRAIKHKVDVMNTHWRDYDRLFTMPNP